MGKNKGKFEYLIKAKRQNLDVRIKKGDLIKSRFDNRLHKVLDVFISKIYWSENEDGTGEKHSASPEVVLETFFIEPPKKKGIPTEVSTKIEPKPLFLIMEKFWFDEILSGRKKIEYRVNTPFYQSRFFTKDGTYRNYKNVLMQVGYNADARRMIIEIKKIVLDGDFEIHLGKVISTENI